jgi:hypothetical protein
MNKRYMMIRMRAISMPMKAKVKKNCTATKNAAQGKIQYVHPLYYTIFKHLFIINMTYVVLKSF